MTRISRWQTLSANLKWCNFSLYYDALLKVMKRTGTKPTDPYDWETPEDVKKVVRKTKKWIFHREKINKYWLLQLARNSKPAAWEEASEFFNSDPMKINEAPTRKTADRNQTKLIASNKDKENLVSFLVLKTNIFIFWPLNSKTKIPILFDFLNLKAHFCLHSIEFETDLFAFADF